MLAAHAMRAKVRLLNFNLAIIERRPAHEFFSNASSDFGKDRDD
jgi:hypothetical protein